MYKDSIETISASVISSKMPKLTMETTIEKTCENIVQEKRSLGETMKTESEDVTHQSIFPAQSSSLPDVEC